MNIFEDLKKRKVKFAVCVAHQTFKSLGSSLHRKDYFIIIKKISDNIYKDLNFISEPGFDAYSRNLSLEEFQEFKTDLNSYEKVIHNKDGRIYEILKT